MKKLHYAFIIAIAMIASITLASCGGQPTENTEAQVEVADEHNSVLSIADLMDLDTTFLGKEVTVAGDVKHVCQHAGRRCFITDDSGQQIRIDAGGEIEAFPSELIGYHIVAKGILREIRISPEQINEMEQHLAEEAQAEGEEGGHCDTERNNILKMRKWMEDNNKNYYRFYYVEGISYQKDEE